MPGILKSDMSVILAEQFINNLSQQVNNVFTNNLYLTIGKSTAWTVENNPPTPKDDLDDETTLRNNIFAMIRVKPSELMLVVPRVDYTVGNTYYKCGYKLNTNNNISYSTQPKRETNYYCVNSQYNVYYCINHTGSPSTTEPTGTSSSINTTNETWKFLYDLNAYVESGFMTKDWIPVPYGNTASVTQSTYGSVNANNLLGAHRVMVNISLEGNYGGIIPYNTTVYRQLGLLYNPTNNAGTLLTNNAYSVNPSSTATTAVDETSGTLFFIDNKVQTTRTDGQIEQIKFILSF